MNIQFEMLLKSALIQTILEEYNDILDITEFQSGAGYIKREEKNPDSAADCRKSGSGGDMATQEDEI